MKQRVRWATGHIQILFQTNPLTMRGLSLAQRLGYFSSIFYFCHGIPRLICLVAPLCALLFGMTPVVADVSSILVLFGSYYVATLVMLRTVSRGTRNAFWSDIYETAYSIALSWATLKTALSPRRRRPFMITQKGITEEQRGASQFYLSIPHLAIMGLLVVGLVTGVRLWIEQRPIPGLEVSLFWGAVNLILVSVSILVAAEVPEWRTLFRIKQRLSCDLVVGEQRLRGVVVDINETGARVHMRKQAQGDLHGSLLCTIKDRTGKYLTLTADFCRQSQLSHREIEIGLKFIDVNEQQTAALIAMTFSDSSVWNQANVEPGIFRSLWSVFRVFHKVWSKSRPSHRQFHRVPYRQECRLVFRNRIVSGTLEQISPTGLSVRIPGSLDLIGAQGTLHAGTCSLKIRRTWMKQCENMVHAGFTIEQVEEGAEQWRELTTLAA